MIIDENKIEELIQQEIKTQVEAKLKGFGRDAIKSVYKDAVRESVDEFLRSKETELLHEVNCDIKYGTFDWNKQIVVQVAENLHETIASAMESYRNSY